MSFMIFLLSVLASLVIIIIISALSIPLWFLAITLGATISSWVFVGIIILAFLIFLAIFMIGGGLITSYSLTAWTNLFIELNEKGGTSKLIRAVSKLTNNRLS